MAETKKGEREREALTPEEIARIDREEYEEPKSEVLRAPGTGGDPEHKRSKLLTDETNYQTR